MATCKDCIHYDVCRQFRPREHIETLDKLQYVEAVCSGLFKDKNEFAPVVHGRWIFDKEEECYCCSVCEAALNNYRGISVDSPYCHNCGAKMDKE